MENYLFKHCHRYTETEELLCTVLMLSKSESLMTCSCFFRHHTRSLMTAPAALLWDLSLSLGRFPWAESTGHVSRTAATYPLGTGHTARIEALHWDEL